MRTGPRELKAAVCKIGHLVLMRCAGRLDLIHAGRAIGLPNRLTEQDIRINQRETHANQAPNSRHEIDGAFGVSERAGRFQGSKLIALDESITISGGFIDD